MNKESSAKQIPGKFQTINKDNGLPNSPWQLCYVCHGLGFYLIYDKNRNTKPVWCVTCQKTGITNIQEEYHK